ncbi:MAG: type II toxin-antitoxin system RelE/ParE family toxin [Bacteroidales bacterium]|nr:type II toxin-antitoxin system RelE/ParE family toxin [Bacteroidales bacterium]
MNVRWSERAALELAETVAYIVKEFGHQAAIKMRERINDAISSLVTFPYMGKKSFTDEETSVVFYELADKQSSIIYTIFEDEIFIVSVWNNRQDRMRLQAFLSE